MISSDSQKGKIASENMLSTNENLANIPNMAGQPFSENTFSIPSISLPKGGGAIRGIGEKFAVNPVTGTASLNVPIFTSPGRSGFGPSLSLSYDSGSGNGAFGFGWSLSLPSITRKTSKGLPKYEDFNESDVFILSGAEDLVPMFRKDQDGNWLKNADETFVIDEQERNGYTVRQYQPRTEGLFARLERWTNRSTGDIHWRSISKDNILTVYGLNKESRIADPSDEKRIFSWLICESFDDKGNAMVYEYSKEDEKGIEYDLLNVNEQNRIRTANRYIKRIFYGNRKPLLLDPSRTSFRKSHLEISEDDLSLASAGWMFEVVFDYNEGHYVEIPLDTSISEHRQHQLVEASESAGKSWSSRPDPFSAYRSAFEVRTYRRCHRVMMFHRFQELGTEPYLVHSTDCKYLDFDYAEAEQPISVSEEFKHAGSTRFASFIQSIVQSGYLRDETKPVHDVNGARYLTYIKKSMPPLDFEYTKSAIQQNMNDLDDTVTENLPIGVDGKGYQFVDLDGEGVSGILTEQADSWFYKPNLGEGKFGPLETVKVKPSMGDLNSGRQQLLDLAGDGQLDVAQLSGPVKGFYERTEDQKWENFLPFDSFPNISFNDPNLRFVDVTGDGHVDILVTENEVFSWYPSLAEKGFDSCNKVWHGLDEEKGPHLVLSESSQTIYLADMSGDGLTDLVRIRNGEVCYWPNLGYGRFGAKVTMDNCPWFDAPEQFDHKCIRLADIDGSGITDIIYLGGDDGIQLYFNQSGNRWSEVYRISGLQVDNYSTVQVVDLFGKGTACLVWSSPLPGNFSQPMRYLDLMGGVKPHLLFKSTNNLGAETCVQYISSTIFYLADKRDGNPWVTRLPFPVHLVERVETYDYISRNYFVTKYLYHHGYYDGMEREFRGFGMVEQWDTEEFATLTNSDTFPKGDNIEADSNVLPAYTKTWFHTGCYLGRDHISDFFGGLLDVNDMGEYYREPAWLHDDTEARKHQLVDTILPPGLSVDEEFEACRALRGSRLRQELFSKDGTHKAEIPYTVSEQNYTIRLVQPQGQNQHAVFFIHQKEAINYQYERNPEDPRTSHDIILEVDDFGNTLKEVTIGYGRRKADPDLSLLDDQAKQTDKKITYTEKNVTNYIYLDDAYRTALICESISYELTGYSPSSEIGRFIDTEFVRPDPTNSKRLILIFDNTITYEDKPTSGRQRRPIEHARTLYRKNDLSSILPLERIDTLALPGNSYKLAFTPGLIKNVYKRHHSGPPNMIESLLPNPGDVLGGQGGGNGGYIASQELKSGGLFPIIDADDHWWLPLGQIFYSPNTTIDELTYAADNFFLPLRYTNPFGNTTTVIFDSPNNLLITRVEDPVRNTISALGMDYRVLQPFLVMDSNQNRSMVTFDVLGMAVGTAVMGKPDPTVSEGDNLDQFDNNLTDASINKHIINPLDNPDEIVSNATTRIVYDLFAYYRTKDQANPDPPVVYTLVRETHFEPGHQNSKIQHSFSYSDGFGREIQKKIQAETGPLNLEDPNSPVADPRWVGTGWTILNNKDLPVRQYEPYFSRTHLFEFKHPEGFSPVIFYDPLARPVVILHPNNTYEKVVFDNWKQSNYDVNDTVLLDPRVDLDTANIVSKYFESIPDHTNWKTWYQERITGEKGTQEKAAAIKTESHANTPTTSYFDALGRSFVTLQHNGVESNGSTITFPTHVEIDIEGNTREVRDAIIQNGDGGGRIVILYDYNMLGNVIHQTSMDGNKKWMLNDVLGNPIRGWDSRRHTFVTEYDTLRRQIRLRVITIESLDPFEISSALVMRIVYGEQHPQDISLNLRTKIYLHLDQAGVMRNEICDFKGNILSTKRQITNRYRGKLDWRDIDVNNVIPENGTTKINFAKLESALASLPQEDQLEETFVSSSEYDALNRPILTETPHSTMPPNIIKPFYNQANMLEKLDVNLRSEQQNGQAVWTPFVVDIDYDAKGRRVQVEYGSGYISNSHHGVITKYRYDKPTSRLVQMVTERNALIFPDDCPPPQPSWPGCKIQNLSFTHDPVGNITHIQDDAQQSIFFRNKRIEPSSDYRYDPIYRLIEARGREHLGQVGGCPLAHSYNDAGRVLLPWSANDGNAMGNYVEQYIYDAAGNFESMQHRSTSNSSCPGWTRSYNYSEPSFTEPTKYNNQPSSTTISGNNPVTENYLYDEHGNTVRMPHLAKHQNDHEANMNWNCKDELCQVDLEGGGICYYVYDSAGKRIRKVWEKAAGLIEDRIYMGMTEVFRRRDGFGAIKLERETLHVMDDLNRIALVETRTIGQEPDIPIQNIRYQLENQIGSVNVELDEEARIITYEEYSPYGSTLYQSGPILAEVGLKRYRYTGMERDEESGFRYHLARYYLPWLGRWLTCGLEFVPFPHWSPYSYAFDRPTVLTDRVGLSPETSSEKNLRRQTAGTVESIEGLRQEIRKIQNELEELNKKASRLEIEGRTQDIEKLAPNYKDLIGRREWIRAEVRGEQKSINRLLADIEAKEKELGKKIPLNVENPEKSLGDLLKESNKQLKHEMYELSHTKIETPHSTHATAPQEPPKATARYREEAPKNEALLGKMWKSIKGFFGKSGSSLTNVAQKVLVAGALISDTFRFIGDPTPETAGSIATGWGMAYVFAKGGFLIGGPIGGFIGGVIGGVVGGQVGGTLVKGIRFFLWTLRHSPGSLIAPGFATSFTVGGLRYKIRYGGQR